MPDYQKMYCTLFNEVTRIIEQLQEAQQKVEEIYINSDAENIVVLRDSEQ